MEDSPSRRLPLNIAADIGPVLAGIVCSSLLFGSLVTLIGFYIQRHPSDRLLNRLVVTTSFCLCCLSWATGFWLLYYFAIDARYDDMKIVSVPDSATILSATLPFSSVLSQIFFGHRSYRMSERNHLVGFILVVLICCSFACGIVPLVIGNLPKGDLESATPGRDPLNGADAGFLPSVARDQLFSAAVWNNVFLFFSAATDIIISCILIFKISKGWGQIKGFNPITDKWLKNIVILSISSAGITSGFSIILAVLSLTTINSSNTIWSFVTLHPHLCTLNIVGSLLLRGGRLGKFARAGSIKSRTIPPTPLSPSFRHSRQSSRATESIPIQLNTVTPPLRSPDLVFQKPPKPHPSGVEVKTDVEVEVSRKEVLDGPNMHIYDGRTSV